MKLNEYGEFVESVTSEASNDFVPFIDRLLEIGESNGAINIPLLLTGSIGLSSETGEFNEIVKKCIFQGKPFDADAVFHCKRELGDILWYWVNSCRALGFNPEDVLAENVHKLRSRYPGGKFDTWFSENRKDGDL